MYVHYEDRTNIFTYEIFTKIDLEKNFYYNNGLLKHVYKFRYRCNIFNV